MTARAATAPEIAKFAADGQWSKVYAIIDSPPVVFACQVNEVFTTHDRLFEFTYNNVTAGAYGDVLPFQTVLIGSASGLSDYGIGYIRKAASSTKLFVGITSSIDIANDVYATVLQDWQIWPKYPTQLSDGTIYINYDEVYAAQNSTRKSIVKMGGTRILELTGATVATTYAHIGAASYVTSIVGALAGATVTNGTTATPTVTCDTAGTRYVVKVVATAANSTVTTTYRPLYVWSAAVPPTDVILLDNPGNKSSGGWEARLRMYGDMSAVTDRARVVVFAKDYYSNTLGSVGALAGSENVIIDGWIDDDTTVFDKDKGSVEFSVKGPHYWLDRAYDFMSVTLTNVSGTPASFKEMQGLTVDLWMWNFLENYTTALNCIDVTLSGDTRQDTEIAAGAGTLWQQMSGVAEEKIKAIISCNQYGQMFVQVDVPLIPIGSRGSIPVVVTLTKADYESIDIQRVKVTPTSQVSLSGVVATAYGCSTVYGLAPGHIPLLHGAVVSPTTCLASTQAQLNELAGSLLERDNAPLRFSISNLRGNNRLIDIADNQRIGLTIASTDNLRGIAYSGNAIVRSISRRHDPDTGGWSIDLEAVQETEANLYRDGDVPVPVSYDAGAFTFDESWIPDEIPPFDEPTFDFVVPEIPLPAGPAAEPRYCWLIAGGKLYFTSTFDQSDVVWSVIPTGLTTTLYYLSVNNSGRYYVASTREVWSGTFGNPATKIIGETELLETYPSNYQIYCIGCNPVAVDTLAMVVGVRDGYGYIHVGSSSGMATQGAITYYTVGPVYASISYSLGKWLFTHPIGGPEYPTVSRFSGTGASEEYTRLNAGPVHPYSVRAGTSDKAWFTEDSSVLSAAGATTTAGTITPLPATPQAIAVDPTATFLMTADENENPYRSTDAGANWNLFTFPKTDVSHSAIYCIDANRFVWASGRKAAGYHDSGIYSTVDFGDNWIDKTGNMSLIQPQLDEFLPQLIMALP